MSTCGIGGWGGPLPGDPSNNSVLSATPAFGGIDVRWTYPATNPQAVAYVKLYRGITGNFASALLIAEVGGSHYYDKVNADITYYYWIRIVSVNGTEGDLIGPASATARPLIKDVIEDLTGQIDTSLLGTALKGKIDEIDLLRNDLQSEITDREGGQTTLADAIADAQAGIAQAHTFIATETASRVSATSALATQLDVVAATLGASIAAIQTVSQAEIDDINNSITALQTTQVAATGRMNTLEGELDAQALVQTTLQSQINGLTGDITALQTDQVQVELGLDNVASAQTTLSANINAVTGTVNAMYTAKLTVNGLVGGFGLSNNGTQVDAGFDVDTFWVGRTNANKRKPFIIVGSETFIDEAVINKLTFSKLRDESGSFVVENGKVKADYISGKGLTITDSLGNIILNAGSSTFLGNVTGSVNGTSAATLTGNVNTALTNASTALTNASNAQTTANSAVTGLTTRLRSDAQNILSGPGGLATGTLAWDANGQRTGGYGVGLTQKGLVAYNSAGNVTFSLDGTTGNASFAGALAAATGTFAGSLSAASGTFAGTLTAAAINAVNTINIAGNAVSATATASGTATTISTTVTVPAGETFRAVGLGFQAGTAPDYGSTNVPLMGTLTIARGAGTFSAGVSPAVVKIVDGEAQQTLWGYAAANVTATEDLPAGTHTISLTGESGLNKVLIVLINKR